MAESPSIEQKMKNKGIITNLVNLLSWESDELTILAVSFLKKLSIYGENKDEMVSNFKSEIKRYSQLAKGTIVEKAVTVDTF